MANEKKNVEALQESQEVIAPATEANEAPNENAMPEKIEGADIVTGLSVVRRSFRMNEGEKDEKECFDYLLKAIFPYANDEKTYDIHMVPSDVGGYDVLDLIYNVGGTVDFVLRPWTIKADKKRGIEAGSGFTCLLRSVVLPELELKVRPAKDSDKALLKALLSISGFKL